jgi:hypothetical protein
MPQDPRERVIAWLNRSGFPFEMRIAAALEQAGFAVAQSVYYIDPESEDAREADILASAESVTGEAFLRFTLVVECKARRDAGWVLFPRRGTPVDASTRVRMLTAPTLASPYLSRIARRADVRALLAFGPRRPAYAMAQAKPVRERGQPRSAEDEEDDGKDHAYAAMMSVAKATSFLLSQVSQNDEDDEFEALWPVITTESPLYEARLTGDGNVDLESVSEGTLSWRHPTARGVLAIDVVHASAAEEYIAKAKAAVDLLLYNTSQELSAVAAKRAARRRAASEAQARAQADANVRSEAKAQPRP